MKANDNQACNFFFSLKISWEISRSFLTRYPLSSPMMLNIDRKPLLPKSETVYEPSVAKTKQFRRPSPAISGVFFLLDNLDLA